MLDTPTQRSFEQRFAVVRSLKQEDLILPREQARLTLMDVAPKSFFTFLDETYYVQKLAQYHETDAQFAKRTGFVTTELTCLCLGNGNTAHFEFEFDDHLEVSLTLWTIKFRDLTDEGGLDIDEDDLDQIADDKDVVIYQGEKFWYDDDWAAVYMDGDTQEQVHVYEFENEAGNSTITIEEWCGSGREEYKLYVSKPVDSREFTLVSRGTPKETE